MVDDLEPGTAPTESARERDGPIVQPPPDEPAERQRARRRRHKLHLAQLRRHVLVLLQKRWRAWGGGFTVNVAGILGAHAGIGPWLLPLVAAVFCLVVVAVAATGHRLSAHHRFSWGSLLACAIAVLITTAGSYLALRILASVSTTLDTPPPEY